MVNIKELKKIGMEKAWRSVCRNADTIYCSREGVDPFGAMSLPTIYWAGIKSQGGYTPDVCEWMEEVTKRWVRTTLCRIGYTHASATWMFYNG